MDGTGKPGGSTGEDHDTGRIPPEILKRMEMQPPYCAGLHPEQLHKMPVRGKERGGVTMAKYNHTKLEWKNALIFSKKVSLFPALHVMSLLHVKYESCTKSQYLESVGVVVVVLTTNMGGGVSDVSSSNKKYK